MNLLTISVKNIFFKPLSSLLSLILFGFGVSIIVSILLVNSVLKDEITKNASGIDLVVGAKGSPLQIILATVFHIDFPTGNIGLNDANDLSKNRLIRTAIPMSLGDSYLGYRIVGTTGNYPELYNATLREGEWFGLPMTATVGAGVAEELGLEIGDELESSHGLSEGAGGHEEHPFKIVGILESSGSVIDQLILVSIQSVWEVHGEHPSHEPMQNEVDEMVRLEKLGLEVTREQLEEKEITALLIQYRSPMAAIQLPRTVNSTSNLQAASPPYETARLFNIIGVGVEVINILGLVIVFLSASSVFIALFNSLKERRYELAIMRSMGASRSKIFRLILLEGLLLSLIGSVIGFCLAHFGYYLLIVFTQQNQLAQFLFIHEEYYVLVGSLLVGIFASIIPAAMAYRFNISKTLSRA